MSYAELIAKHLLNIAAVKLSPESPFTWASGMKSPIYCDNRKTLSFPEVRNDVKRALVAVSAEFGAFDVVAGVATAGIPHGVLLADVLGKPFCYVRSKPKEHGLKNMIEGELAEGARVLVVEDLISTGGSSLQAVEAVREAGAEVVGVLAIFSYCFEEASRRFEAAGCPLRTLSDYPTLLQVAVSEGKIAEADLAKLNRWRETGSLD